MTKNPPKLSFVASPMQVGDMDGFVPQGQQLGCEEIMSAGYDRHLMSGGPAYTVRRPDGSVICFLGLMCQWEGRALAWAILGEGAGKYLLPLTRQIDEYLAGTPFRRIEAYIDEGFGQAHRWARILKFSCETPQAMRGFYPNGNAAYMYARLNHG